MPDAPEPIAATLEKIEALYEKHASIPRPPALATKAFEKAEAEKKLAWRVLAIEMHAAFPALAAALREKDAAIKSLKSQLRSEAERSHAAWEAMKEAAEDKHAAIGERNEAREDTERWKGKSIREYERYRAACQRYSKAEAQRDKAEGLLPRCMEVLSRMADHSGPLQADEPVLGPMWCNLMDDLCDHRDALLARREEESKDGPTAKQSRDMMSWGGEHGEP